MDAAALGAEIVPDGEDGFSIRNDSALTTVVPHIFFQTAYMQPINVHANILRVCA